MKLIIVGLTQHPGHFSHIVAFYRMGVKCGFDTSVLTYADSVKYLPNNVDVIIFGSELPRIDAALVSAPSKDNLALFLKLKFKFNTRIAMVFHEPLTSYSVYREAGFSKMQMLKLRLGNIYESLLVKIADIILLASQKGLSYYDANNSYTNKNREYFPLIFDDEYFQNERKYVSYIGTVASDHSFNEFLAYVKWAWKNSKIPGLKFLIATKSNIELDASFDDMLNDGFLKIVHGKPMTNEEINGYYASSLVVWNAYVRTTQSGVLPKAFMFGCPAIVLKKNLSDNTITGENVVAVENNQSCMEIDNAIETIIKNFHHYSDSARKTFLNKYYWGNYSDQFKRIING